MPPSPSPSTTACFFEMSPDLLYHNLAHHFTRSRPPGAPGSSIRIFPKCSSWSSMVSLYTVSGQPRGGTHVVQVAVGPALYPDTLASHCIPRPGTNTFLPPPFLISVATECRYYHCHRQIHTTGSRVFTGHAFIAKFYSATAPTLTITPLMQCIPSGPSLLQGLYATKLLGLLSSKPDASAPEKSATPKGTRPRGARVMLMKGKTPYY